MRIGRGLVLACHPLPTLAVTAISAGLAALAHTGPATGTLVVLAVFTGQLSVGWSNDLIDAPRDRATDRGDKPLVTGVLSTSVVRVATAAAVTATVVLSLSLGYRAGLVALLTVASAWAYNLRLKSSAWSWLPYAVSFGLLPAIATLAASPHRWPAAWAVAAGALLGVSAHFANVLPDLAGDEATGVRGLPHRVGARPTVVIGPLLLLGATATIVANAAGRLGAGRWFALGACAAVVAMTIGLGLTRPASKLFFLGTVAVALADVVLFGLSGGRLT
jgi:4-hydroxybenzoate polyprenyltransferase